MSGMLERLRRLLDLHVVGHTAEKEAILLGLVCREHVYLEGPPGTAKTRMAEVAAAGTSLPFFFYQLHRDTRLSELVGDVVLERQPLEGGAGERIRQRIEPGGLLRAAVCVLDDLSRAPGEALNVLLRILNERKFGETPLPLMCAIATGNPLRDEYYNEPLDPAHLDRFSLQLRVEGLLQSGAPEARTLLDRFVAGTVEEQPDPERVGDRAGFDALYTALGRLLVPEVVKQGLLDVCRTLVERGCDATNSLLTDRSFLVKAVKLLRGRALLAGRHEVRLEDLAVLEWMTTFRLPAEVHAQVPEIVARIVAAGDPQPASGARLSRASPRGRSVEG
jgi:MoxR-like ATPase